MRLSYLLIVLFALGSFITIQEVSAIEPDFYATRSIPYNVSIPCDVAGYLCPSGIQCNASMKYPDSTYDFNNQIPSLSNNYLLIRMNHTDTRFLGDYQGAISCSDPSSGLNASTSFIVRVTQTGNPLSSSQAIVYGFVLFFALLFLGIFTTGGATINSDYKRDEMTGYIFALNNLKYLKIFCWALAYLTFMLITYLAWMLSLGYLEMEFIASIFQFAFYFMAVSTVPLFIVGTYIVIANAVRDHKVAEALSLGAKIR